MGSGAGKPSHAGNVHYLNLCNDNTLSGEFQESAALEETRASVEWGVELGVGGILMYCLTLQLVPNICKHEINYLMGTNCSFLLIICFSHGQRR